MNKKKSVNVYTESVWVSIGFECPLCCWENSIEIKEFIETNGDYPGDWHAVKCEGCDEEFDIDEVEYD